MTTWFYSLLKKNQYYFLASKLIVLLKNNPPTCNDLKLMYSYFFRYIIILYTKKPQSFLQFFSAIQDIQLILHARGAELILDRKNELFYNRAVKIQSHYKKTMNTIEHGEYQLMFNLIDKMRKNAVQFALLKRLFKPI